jgi:hypothetical protein
MLHSSFRLWILAAFVTDGKEVNSMSDRGHIHTLIANREQQLYGALRDGVLSFQKNLFNIIEEICKTMSYDFRDLYLKIVFKTQPDTKSHSLVCCTYCTSRIEKVSEDDKYYPAGETFSVKNDVLDYFYSRVIALDANRKGFTESKLGAYKFDCATSSGKDSPVEYTYTIVYTLGGNKITEKK